MVTLRKAMAGALVGALLAIAAAAVVGPGAEAEVKATETYNTAVFAEATKALEAAPAAPAIEQPSPEAERTKQTDPDGAAMIER
jgi:hypothetical protein